MGSRTVAAHPTCSVLFMTVGAFLLCIALPSPSGAQTVQGQLLETGTDRPLQGALLLLIDANGGAQDGYLTNDAGRFLLRAPRPGRYTIRAERLGFQTVTSEPYDLDRDQTVTVRLETSAAPIELEGFRVEGEQQCVVRPGDGLVLAQVWEELRKALTVQEWTDREGLDRFQVTGYERELDPQTRLVVAENRRTSGWVSRNPIQSLPVEDLMGAGFIQPDGDVGFVYHGPDATVLLSDHFLDTHCFNLEVDDRRPGMLGLSFQPVRDTSLPDVFGTLWLDRQTARLRFLEFGYTWSPWVEAIGVAEGQVHFEELPSGAWIVRRWWIRMPRMVRDLAATGAGRSGLRVAGITEAGGEVTQIASPPSRRLDSASDGVLTGMVWDSTRMVPLVDAKVYLSGTHYSAETDSAGVFTMAQVPQGFYRASFTHPKVDSLGVYPAGEDVSIAVGEATEVILTVPSRESILEAICSDEERAVGTSAVVGTVRSLKSGGPLPGARVILEWARYGIVAGRDLQAIIQSIEAVTDARGRYRACGVPPGVIVRLRATLSGTIGGRREFTTPRDEVVVVDLAVDLRGPAPDR